MGKAINANMKINSEVKRSSNKIISAKITNVFIEIPINIENPTSPFLYSFFHGLKYVFTKIGREKRLRNALFKEAKKPISPFGASKNQNLKTNMGRLK